MCTGSKPSQPAPPAPAPPPPADPPEAPVIDEGSANERNLVNSTRAGRNSFRIDPIGTAAVGGGSGLNIPVA